MDTEDGNWLGWGVEVITDVPELHYFGTLKSHETFCVNSMVRKLHSAQTVDNDINDTTVSVFWLGWICATRCVQVANYIRSSTAPLAVWLCT